MNVNQVASGILALTLTALNLCAQHGESKIYFINLELVVCWIRARQKPLIRVQGLDVLAEIIMRRRNEKVRRRNFGTRGGQPFIFGNGFRESLQFIKREGQVRVRGVVVWFSR